MISWLKGEKIENWQNGTRLGVLIACSGIGYEVQLLRREIDLTNDAKELILWVHQVQKEDGSQLIGFLEKLERDLFRKLISISGIGPQLAISLLEQNPAKSLILAITNKSIAQLTSCPGIGSRTAERLIIELQNKLSELIPSEITKLDNGLSPESDPTSGLRDEVRSALINLGYKNLEIEKAFRELEVSSKFLPLKNDQDGITSENNDFSGLIKETLFIINKHTR